jgi:Family of unknown function (DUF6519)
MDGDFKPDITRDSFNITNRLKRTGTRRSFSRVLKQQGRVELDADWNELVDILLQQQRTALVDIIGPHAGPIDDDGNAPGFAIGKSTSSLKKQEKCVQIGAGHYYVDGLLCETEEQKCYMVGKGKVDRATQYLLYLDVWEREVTALEDDAIRESALGGPDTTTRAEIVWRVRAQKYEDIVGTPAEKPTQGEASVLSNAWTKLLHKQLSGQSTALLKARTDPTTTSTDPCITAPSSSYRGLENQLYRVEIHRGGKAQSDGAEQDCATFKWSRENGSITFSVDGKVSIAENVTLKLKNLGSDNTRYMLKQGDWVELIDLSLVPDETPGLLFRVKEVDTAIMQVTLASAEEANAPTISNVGPFLLRRWDYKPGDPTAKEQEDRPITIADDGAATLVENHWLTLEDGIQVEFFAEKVGTTTYRSGDYWLIPARVATGELEWPMHEEDKPKARRKSRKRLPWPLPPQGVLHHYAPLALVTFQVDGTIGDKPGAPPGTPDIINLRRKITKGWASF